MLSPHLHTVYGTVQMYTDAGTDSTMYMYIHVTFNTYTV